jgi:hypothetical protein
VDAGEIGCSNSVSERDSSPVHDEQGDDDHIYNNRTLMEIMYNSVRGRFNVVFFPSRAQHFPVSRFLQKSSPAPDRLLVPLKFASFLPRTTATYRTSLDLGTNPTCTQSTNLRSNHHAAALRSSLMWGSVVWSGRRGVGQLLRTQAATWESFLHYPPT